MSGIPNPSLSLEDIQIIRMALLLLASKANSLALTSEEPAYAEDAQHAEYLYALFTSRTPEDLRAMPPHAKTYPKQL